MEEKYNTVIIIKDTSMTINLKFYCSVVGATVIVCGFYAVMWGEAREDKKGEDIVVGSSSETPSGKVPLLQKKTTEDV